VSYIDPESIPVAKNFIYITLAPFSSANGVLVPRLLRRCQHKLPRGEKGGIVLGTFERKTSERCNSDMSIDQLGLVVSTKNPSEVLHPKLFTTPARKNGLIRP